MYNKNTFLNSPSHYVQYSTCILNSSEVQISVAVFNKVQVTCFRHNLVEQQTNLVDNPSILGRVDTKRGGHPPPPPLHSHYFSICNLISKTSQFVISSLIWCWVSCVREKSRNKVLSVPNLHHLETSQ